MAIYQIIVTRIDTIKPPRLNNYSSDLPDYIEETVVYQQRKEMDLNKIIMAVNGYTRTK